MIGITIVTLTAGAIYYFSIIKNQETSDQILVSDKPFLDQNVQDNEKEQISGQYSLSIEKINLSAPIILNVDGSNKETYMRALEDGVAHLKSTALPGTNGNLVIFGHSSYFVDKPGNYKKIFAGLNELQVNDKIKIKSEGKIYTYNVNNKSIVKPTDISVVSQNLSKKELTLITCWPINSTEKRLIIKALLTE